MTMKDKNINTDQEFEKLLKDKMNELADSSDCFSKISERVFIEENTDFDDSEFVVTELENITGKRRFSPLLKTAAAGLAAVLVIGFVPKTTPFRKLMCNIGSPNSDTFTGLVREITESTSENSGMDFHVYDMKLEEYINKDILVTPLYSCPFEDIGREDIRVRVFVRCCEDLLTNQIYAVEYSGEFAEENFIAAAETKADFSADDLEKSYNKIQDRLKTSCSAFINELNNSKESIAASFTDHCLFKSLDEVYLLGSNVAYCTSDNGASYSYDIMNFTISQTGTFKDNFYISQTDLKWKYSVYRSGESAFPEMDNSLFKKKTVSTDSNTEGLVPPVSIMPYGDKNTAKNKNEFGCPATLTLSHTIKNIDVPADEFSRSSLKIYINKMDIGYFGYSSESDPKINVTCSDGSVDMILRADDVGFWEHLTDQAEISGAIIVTDDETELSEESERVETNIQKFADEAENRMQSDKKNADNAEEAKFIIDSVMKNNPDVKKAVESGQQIHIEGRSDNGTLNITILPPEKEE